MHVISRILLPIVFFGLLSPVAPAAPVPILDTTFNAGGVNGSVLALALQPDGKLIVGGGFRRISGVDLTSFGIARLQPDGTIDRGFVSAATGFISALAFQPDGKLLVCGYLNNAVSGYESVIRLHPDGSRDTSFTAKIDGIDHIVRTILPLPDGKIIIGGDFESSSGVSRINLARLNADGSVDTSFRGNANGVDYAIKGVLALARESNGRILVGGRFAFVNGVPRYSFARFTADGQLDPTFIPVSKPANSETSDVRAIFVQADGKILVGGNLYSTAAAKTVSVARFNPDGTLDPAFSLAESGTAEALALLPDGKIFVGGGFFRYGDLVREPFVVLQPNGEFDATLNPPNDRAPGSAYPSIYAALAAPDGRVFLGGSFPTLYGQSRNSLARLVPPSPLFIIPPPPTTIAGIGTSLTFAPIVSGLPATYQWRKNGFPLPGATAASLTLVNLKLTDAGTYDLVATNSAGTVTSPASIVSVGTAPAIVVQPLATTAIAGQQPATFSVVATAIPAPTYQWSKNGTAIPGATTSAFALASTQPSDAGVYTCAVTNAYGTVITTAATLTILPAARLSNVSVRTTLASSQSLIVGYVVGGGSTEILVRAAGPALATFGISTALPDPRIELYQASTKILENDNWPASLSASATTVGAFSFAPSSRDAALLHPATGAYSVLASGTTAGVVLVETYDLAASGSAAGNARLINISARNQVGTDADILIAGFNLTGFGTRRILLRAVGPTLGGVPFLVPGVLADPKLALFDGAGTKIAENDNWEDSLAPTFAASGAFALSPNSLDAALLVILPAGAYTAQISGVAATTGVALVEVYEVP